MNGKTEMWTRSVWIASDAGREPIEGDDMEDAIKAAVAMLAEIDQITARQGSLLLHLVDLEVERRSVGALRSQFSLSEKQLAADMKKLTELGFIERVRSPLDRRLVVLSLTEKGRQRAQEVLHPLDRQD